MCGILGQINKWEIIHETSFSAMLSTLQNRGPDGSGTKFLKNGRVALGHKRLTIIDLTDAGLQPMANEDGTIWLVFNGEIYNYLTLRRYLEQQGHKFKSNTDSECIIHAYEEWGYDSVKYLRGIFAFGIYDSIDDSLFIARDQLGVKPLYYYSNTDAFIFASQPRAIIRSKEFDLSVDIDALSLYLGYGNIPGDKSIYSGVKKLLPGHWLLLKNNQISMIQYWKLEIKPQITDVEEALQLLHSKVLEAVEHQTVSDVPLGVLLSGGIDSTIILSVLTSLSEHRVPSFTVGFQEESHDERKYANLVAKAFNSDHQEQLLTSSSAYSLLPSIIDAYDEPFHLSGLFPYYALSRLVQRNGFKVMHGGDGADEIFAGYLWYDDFFKWRNSTVPRQSILNRIGGLFNNQNVVEIHPVQKYFNYNGFFDPDTQAGLLGNKMKGVDTANVYAPLTKYWNPDVPSVLAAQLLDFNCFLVDHCLTKVDRASMHCGVEVRVPFLDIELVQLAFSIDHNLIYHDGERKALLKQAMSKHLPKKMDQRRKKGFSSPLNQWLQEGLSHKGKQFLINGSLCANEYLDYDAITKLYDQFGASKQLLLISLELWYRHWIDNDYHAATWLFDNKL